MTILIHADIAGQTGPGYEHMLGLVLHDLRHAPGLILHATHAINGGWRVIELWRTKTEADRFYAAFVAPKLPAGIRPKRAVQPLHNIVLPVAGCDSGPAGDRDAR